MIDLHKAANEGNEREKIALDMYSYRVKNTSEVMQQLLEALMQLFLPDVMVKMTIFQELLSAKD